MLCHGWYELALMAHLEYNYWVLCYGLKWKRLCCPRYSGFSIRNARFEHHSVLLVEGSLVPDTLQASGHSEERIIV
jgi:hypothetical protein